MGEVKIVKRDDSVEKGEQIEEERKVGHWDLARIEEGMKKSGHDKRKNTLLLFCYRSIRSAQKSKRNKQKHLRKGKRGGKQ